MIVKCDKCQTRFKIPDEKVTDKGVKVRCTKCQHTFRVGRAPVVPAPDLAPPADDPFARYGIPVPPGRDDPAEHTRPGFYAEGVAASRAQAVLGQHQDVPDEVFDSPTRVAPLPDDLRAELSRLAAPKPTAAPPSPFDPSDPFAGMGVGGPALAPRPETDFEQTTPFSPAFLPQHFDPAPSPPRSQVAAAQLAQLPPAAPSPAPFGDDDPFGAPSGGLLGDLPPPDEDFGPPGGGLGAGHDRGLFDMPAPPPGPLPDLPALPQAAPAPRLPSPGPQLPPVKPAGQPDGVGLVERQGQGPLRRMGGLVLNLLAASALLGAVLWVGAIYLNEGRLEADAFSLQPLQALFSPPAELRAVEVSNGLYDTQGGRRLFYVRGEVENRSATSARVRVRVEIADGALVVGRADGWAGFSPSPEDLHALSSAADLKALVAKAEPSAVSLAPGGRQPFLVAFYDYPPELSQYRLKVTVEREADPEETAAR